MQHTQRPLELEIKENFQSLAAHCPKQNRKHHQERNIHHHTTSQRKHPRSTRGPEPGQSADEEYEVTTVVVATMVQPSKGTVNDITVGTATGAVNCACTVSSTRGTCRCTQRACERRGRRARKFHVVSISGLKTTMEIGLCTTTEL